MLSSVHGTVKLLVTVDKLMQRVFVVLLRWLRLGIHSKWLDQVPRALEFVTEQGRMKYVRPLYRELYDWEDVRAQTIEHFKKTRAQMMHVCATMVAKDLHL